MQTHLLSREGHPDLVVFALGWTSQPEAVAHIRPAGCDILCLYDYRTMETFDPASLAGYRRVYLFAWSFGVFMAERVFRDFPFAKTVALNGTPRPVDDRYGIPAKSFGLTLRGIRRSGTGLFEQRTFGGFYPTAATWPRSRTLEEKTEELEVLHRLSQETAPAAFRWNEAVVGGQELIFPPENQLAYWRECSPATHVTKEEAMPHYPFADPAVVLSRLE